MVKNPPANAGEVRDTSSFLGLGRSPGGGHGNPLQCSCLENPMDRGAVVHNVAKSQTQLMEVKFKDTFKFINSNFNLLVNPEKSVNFSK